MIKTTETRGEIQGKTHLKSLAKMDAIASGVQARIEELTGCSRRVTEETVNIARALGVPGCEIERWVAYRRDRLARDAGKLNELKSRLTRANRPNA